MRPRRGWRPDLGGCRYRSFVLEADFGGTLPPEYSVREIPLKVPGYDVSTAGVRALNSFQRAKVGKAPVSSLELQLGSQRRVV